MYVPHLRHLLVSCISAAISLIPRPHSARIVIASSILKVIHAVVGFVPGTDTKQLYTHTIRHSAQFVQLKSVYCLQVYSRLGFALGQSCFA